MSEASIRFDPPRRPFAERIAKIMDMGDRALAFWLLLPTASLLALIIVYPVARLFYTSLFKLSLTSGLPAKFIGLHNYSLMFTDPEFWSSLWNTLLITIVTVPGALVFGMVLALIANMPFRVRWGVRLALLLPWALPLVFCGLIFAWFFQSQYGLVNGVLSELHLPTVIWFNSKAWSMTAICLALTWKTSSFVAMILLAGLQSIPGSLYESAEIDGAGRIRQFFEITLPLLKPAIAVAMIFRTITALQAFVVPFAMTRGGPGISTVTLAMYIQQNTIDFLDLGYGSALAVAMFALSMIVSVVYLRMIRRAG